MHTKSLDNMSLEINIMSCPFCIYHVTKKKGACYPHDISNDWWHATTLW